jgi:outer membrane protein assembly factor BamB
VSGEPRDAVVAYPGGIRVRYRWAGSGEGPALFALTEAGGSLTELGGLIGEQFEPLCRAEVRVEGPAGTWTVRLASAIFDVPAGLAWDSAGLIIVKYGFHSYGLDARSGELRWSHRSPTPLVAVLGSSRLEHVIAQSEVETFALDAAGSPVWRVGHSDVVAEAELIAGRLVLTSYSGLITSLDASTGRPTA